MSDSLLKGFVRWRAYGFIHISGMTVTFVLSMMDKVGFMFG